MINNNIDSICLLSLLLIMTYDYGDYHLWCVQAPTPVMDSISSQQSDRWSVPVLDDKPSTQTEELALEDIPQSGNIIYILITVQCNNKMCITLLTVFLSPTN